MRNARKVMWFGFSPESVIERIFIAARLASFIHSEKYIILFDLVYRWASGPQLLPDCNCNWLYWDNFTQWYANGILKWDFNFQAHRAFTCSSSMRTFRAKNSRLQLRSECAIAIFSTSVSSFAGAVMMPLVDVTCNQRSLIFASLLNYLIFPIHVGI